MAPGFTHFSSFPQVEIFGRAVFSPQEVLALVAVALPRNQGKGWGKIFTNHLRYVKNL